MKRVAILLACGGCNLVFGVEGDPAPTADASAIDTVLPDVPVAPGRDEDEDSVPNATDNCPGIANGLQATGQDSDTVGDACDLYPGTEEAILTTQFFNDPLDAGWTVPVGWTLAAGEASVSVVESQAQAITTRVTGQRITVEVGYVLAATAPDSEFIRLAIDGAVHQSNCEISVVGNGTRSTLSMDADSVPGSPLEIESITGGFHLLQFSYDPNGLRCRIDAVGKEASTSVRSDTGELTVSVTIANQSASLRYVTVYGAH